MMEPRTLAPRERNVDGVLRDERGSAQMNLGVFCFQVSEFCKRLKIFFEWSIIF